MILSYFFLFFFSFISPFSLFSFFSLAATITFINGSLFSFFISPSGERIGLQKCFLFASGSFCSTSVL